jgi:hypothetical protein
MDFLPFEHCLVRITNTSRPTHGIQWTAKMRIGRKDLRARASRSYTAMVKLKALYVQYVYDVATGQTPEENKETSP